jgi:hypothetical protein
MPSLKEIVQRILAIAPTISSGQLARARHAPEQSAKWNECFSNADCKVQQNGGSVVYGWTFQARALPPLPDGWLIAVNHAVWLAPRNELIDVTPFHPDPNEHPIVFDGAVVFLVDGSAKPLRTDKDGVPLPSWYFPLTDDKAAASHVAKLNANELAEWKRQVAKMAADLIQRRRKLLSVKGK